MSANTRTVWFIENQGAEDLYRCKENGKVYLRQPCDKEHVRWLTGSRWSGGYEASCALKEGLELCIVDRNGNILFQETVVREEGYERPVTKKVAPFSYEVKKAFAAEVAKEFNLASYDAWSSWLMAEAVAANFTGFADNWRYSLVEYSDFVILSKVDYMGTVLYLTEQEARHRICGKTWTCYELRTQDMSTCAEICGYALNGRKEKENAEC